MTWRHALFTFALCAVWSALEAAAITANFSKYAHWGPIVNSFVSMQLNGFAVLFAVLIADVTSASQRRWRPYVIAVVSGVALGTTVFWFISQCVFTIPTAVQLRGLHDGMGAVLYRHGITRFAICGLTAYVYVCWQFSRQKLDALREVQREGLSAQKRLVETRFAFTQARVEPEFLIGTLTQIERLYEVDAPAADRLLNALIVYLRAAIPQNNNSTSTVEAEIRLTNAYLNVVGLQARNRLVVRGIGASIASQARMPPMVLRPLVNFALAHRSERASGDERFIIDLAVRDGELLVTIQDQGSGFASEGAFDAELERIRDRLATLYGHRAKLILRDLPSGTEAVVEIPYELATSNALA